jgi:hypothetical protein
MPTIFIEIMADGSRNTRDLIADIVRAHLHPLKPKMRYRGQNGPIAWVRANIASDDIKSIDAFMEKHGDCILDDIRKHNIKMPNSNRGAFCKVHLLDCQFFQDVF